MMEEDKTAYSENIINITDNKANEFSAMIND
jgi:hypothetical protein